jgi:hypothetical protein
MPQSTHNKLAELHNLAAHSHSAAATAHGKGDHLTAHELSKQAHEHSTMRRTRKPSFKPSRRLIRNDHVFRTEQ